MSKKLEELQNKFKEENQDQLQENSELLENKIKKMEKDLLSLGLLDVQ